MADQLAIYRININPIFEFRKEMLLAKINPKFIVTFVTIVEMYQVYANRDKSHDLKIGWDMYIVVQPTADSFAESANMTEQLATKTKQHYPG